MKKYSKDYEEMEEENTGEIEKRKSSSKVELSIKQLGLDEKTRVKRKKWAWTKTNTSRGNDLVRIFNEMHPWWPLTERQLYYRLISNPCITHNHWHKFGKIEKGPLKDVYGTVGQLLKWLRIEEKVPWEAITDETRTLTDKVGFSSAKDFVERSVDRLFRGYSRCVAADQPNHIEVWIEKQALLNIVEPIADKYCRQVMCCKGYNSITFQADFYKRATEAIMKGYQPVVLYFGDWDPSGVSMINAAMQTLEDELDLFGVDFYRCGINPEHFHLIEADPVPLKKTDSRTKKFIKEHGPTCYELDAFHPLELQELVKKSIRQFTNLDSITCNLNIQDKEQDLLTALKSDVGVYISNRFNDMGGNEYEASPKPPPPPAPSNFGNNSEMSEMFDVFGEMFGPFDPDSIAELIDGADEED